MNIRSLLFSAALAFAPACASAQLNPSDDGRTQVEGIAAIVNDEPISFTDVRQRATLLLMGIAQQPTPEVVQQVTGQALEQLIDERLQIQKAAEYEVEIEADEIAAAIGDMAAQSNITREALYQQLTQVGVNPASLEEQMRAEIAWRRIMGGLYGSRIRISPNQVSDQLDRLRRSATQPQYQVAEIFLYTADEQEKVQARAAAQTLLNQLRQGAPFPLAAQRFSSAPTAATGGDMGWVSVDTLDTPLRDALQAMSGPGITDPIEVDNGIYLLALRSKREPADQATIVNMRQLVATDGSEDTLNAALRRIDVCDDIEDAADSNPNLTAVTLPEIKETDLNTEMRARVAATPEGSASTPYTSAAGVSTIFVCSRSIGSTGLPTRAQVEDRLYGRQLGMVSDRALRDLKREATIIRR